MASWHWNTLRTIGLLGGKSTGHRYKIRLLRPSNVVSLKQLFNKLQSCQYIWDAMMFMWRHPNHLRHPLQLHHMLAHAYFHWSIYQIKWPDAQQTNHQSFVQLATSDGVFVLRLVLLICTHQPTSSWLYAPTNIGHHGYCRWPGAKWAPGHQQWPSWLNCDWHVTWPYYYGYRVITNKL